MNKIYKINDYIYNLDDWRNQRPLGDRCAHIVNDNEDGEMRFKKPYTVNGTLSEVVLAKIYEALGQKVAKQKLAHIKVECSPHVSYDVYGIVSKNFLKDGDDIKQFILRYNLAAPVDFRMDLLYLSKHFDFHNLNLENFFEKNLKDESEEFKKEFLGYFLSSTFVGNLDKPYGRNVSSIVRDDGGQKEHHMAPHYDHDFSMFFTEPSEYVNIMGDTNKSLAVGIDTRNMDYIKKHYLAVWEKFNDRLVTLKNSPQFVDICDMTGLEDFYEQYNEKKNVKIERAGRKLERLSARICKSYKDRIDLLTQSH